MPARDINVMALVKGGERYVFLYDDDSRVEALRTLSRFASDPDLSFSWHDAAMLGEFSQLTVRAAGHRIPFHRTYADVPPGGLLALVNSFDVLEIAVAEQNAANTLGLSRGGPVVVEGR